jgi:acetoin:2,6-dichlorophenolindophenol oxidoreductase subunit alpha
MQQSRDDLLRAYRTMRLIREFEERLHVEFATGEIPGFVHLYAGEEATAAGVCAHLGDKDAIASNHRGHGHCIAKGCDPNAMMAEIYGRASGLCGGKGGSMHIADLSKGMMGANGIVGAGTALVCGAALSAKTLGTGAVAVAFTGDGGSNQGTVFEAMNLASVWKLPAIFVFENNGYGEASAAEWALAGGDIVRRAAAFDMPGHQVDGTDYFAVWEAMRQATERARGGEGPSLIECRTKRYYGHFEGDTQAYRSKEEVPALRAEKDPLELFRKRVLSASLLSEVEMARIDADTKSAIDAAVTFAKAAPLPAPEMLTRDVYVAY